MPAVHGGQGQPRSQSYGEGVHGQRHGDPDQGYPIHGENLIVESQNLLFIRRCTQIFADEIGFDGFVRYLRSSA
jgi:hypothetical protein